MLLCWEAERKRVEGYKADYKYTDNQHEDQSKIKKKKKSQKH